MKRAMCIYFPAWPLERLWHDRPELRDRPVALYDPHAARGSRVVLGSTKSVRPGMPLAEAPAIEPRLHAEPHEPEADRLALERLAEWAGRFSPIVALEEIADLRPSAAGFRPSTLDSRPSALLLDITGCAACFGGEDKLLRRAVRELREQGWTVRVAIADTVGGAWALAHYGHTPSLVPPGRTVAALLPLPAAALRLPAETVRALAELGIERIGELAALPRPSLPARLGPLVLQRLDQATGRLPEVLVPHRPLPIVEDLFSFEYATDQRDAISYALDQLTERVCHTLQERNAGARQIECWLHHEAARPTRLEVGLYRPSRAPRHLKMLLRIRLERATIDEPVSAVSLRVPATAPLDADQAEIFDTDSARDAGELARLLDELSSRLGRDAVARARLVADAQPEYACCYEPVIEPKAEGRRPKAENQKSFRPELPAVGFSDSARPSSSGSRPSAVGRRLSAGSPSSMCDIRPVATQRPLRLWPEPAPIPTTSVVPEGPPVRFRWAGMEHRVVRAWGPERIETGWWRGRDVQRDYYLVETASGARFWIYRRRDDGRWFLHGCFD